MKKRLIIIVIFALLLVSCSNTNNKHVSILEKEDLNSKYVTWHGRNEYKNKSKFFYNTATGFKVKFNGFKLSFTLEISNNKEEIYFQIVKNGIDEIISFGEKVNNVEILFDSEYSNTFELIKLNEPGDGLTSIKKIQVSENFMTEQDENSEHFLLIGASGISGNGSLGKEGEKRTTKNSSSIHSFGYITAKHFNASYEFVSASGFGLVRGFNDQSGKVNIQSAYQRVGINYDESLIETTNKITKKATNIIINVGGNDFSSYINKLSGKDYSDAIAEFQSGVIDFLTVLRKDHPSANIFWTMTRNSKNGQNAEQAISTMSNLDKSFIHVVTIKKIGEDNTPIGGNNHASYETHKLSANILIEAIETLNNK